jgi:hypothetical protein
MRGDLPETHEADQKPAEPKGNALERLMARLLERKPILYLVFIFTIIGALVSVVASVVGILAFVKDQADDRPSPRLRSAAYRLGDDVFPAAFAGELDLGTAERETVRISTQGFEATSPPLALMLNFLRKGKIRRDSSQFCMKKFGLGL